jgi:hypothetical protein
MKADLAGYTVRRLLKKLVEWRAYAAEPAADFQHAQDKLAALAEVFRTTNSDIVDKWDEYLISGVPTWHYDFDDGGFILSVRIIEDMIRHGRERQDRGPVSAGE